MDKQEEIMLYEYILNVGLQLDKRGAKLVLGFYGIFYSLHKDNLFLILKLLEEKNEN